jgi:hypothetical protein
VLYFKKYSEDKSTYKNRLCWIRESRLKYLVASQGGGLDLDVDHTTCVPINDYDEVHQSAVNWDIGNFNQMYVTKGFHPEQGTPGNAFHVLIKKNNQELISYHGLVASRATCDTLPGCLLCSNMDNLGVRCMECEYPKTLNTDYECKDTQCAKGEILKGDTCHPCDEFSCNDCSPLYPGDCFECKGDALLLGKKCRIPITVSSKDYDLENNIVQI